MNTRELLLEMIRDDLGRGDITTEAVIGSDVRARGFIVARERGMLAGVREACSVFRLAGVRTRGLKKDGSAVRAGDKIMEVKGNARKILQVERVALNLLMRMSGIATATAELVRLAKRANPRVVVAATRKTAPLLTRFDKRAVEVGGGSPHRRDLSEQVLIKRNHVRIVGSIESAVRSAKKAKRRPIEIEVSTAEEALRAARAGADIIMLDNMRVSEVRRAVELLKQEGLREKVVLEVSGGIRPDNIQRYAATGVDVISSGYMTMRAPALDMGLEIVAPPRSTNLSK